VTEGKLTEKEWEVLKFFIKKESEAIETYRRSQRSGPSESLRSFCSYPEDLIRKGLISVSKPKIGDACKKLHKEGILEGKDNKAKNNRKTKFYFLKSDIETIKTLVRLITKKSPKEAIEILSYRYFSYYIDESLVREILSKKSVSISRSIPLIEWERDEAQQLLYILTKEDYAPEETQIKFDDFLKEGIIKYEEENKKREDEYLNHLSKLFQQFFEDLDNPSFDAKKYYYSKDYLLFQNFSYKEVSSFYRKDISEFLTFPLNFPFYVKLPILKDSVPLEERIEAIRKANNPLFFDERSDLKDLTNEDIKLIFSGFNAHYSAFEYEKLVLPILALIWCSPSALYEFLCGEWEGFEMHFTIDGRCEESGFITKLLHTATKDILANLDIPGNTIIDSVSSKKFPPCRSSYRDKICMIPGPEGYRLYEQLRDIEKKYWDSKPYDEIEKFLNSSLRIKLKHLWELFIDVGFSVVSGSSESSRIIESVNMDVNFDVLPRLFTVNDINDAQGLISKLQQKDCPLYCYILSLFSNKVKNVVLVYDTREQPSIQLQQMIVEELNSMLLDGHFYDERAFESLTQEHENVKETFEALSSYRYSKKEILSMVDENTSIESLIIEKNRYLLEKIFENELAQKYVPLVEGKIGYSNQDYESV